MMWRMSTKTRTPRGALPGLLAAACGVLLGGCGGPSVWAWSAPGGPTYQSRAPMGSWQDGPSGPQGGSAGSEQAASLRTNEGVLVFSNSAFVADHAEGSYRRDGVLAARSREALPDRLGWPMEARPDLRRTGSLRTSTQAERWVYPQTRRDHVHRGYPVYPPHRGW